MKSQLLDQSDGRRTYMLVFDIGDEVVSGLLGFASVNRFQWSHFTAVGAFDEEPWCCHVPASFDA
ncbi:MAG TPA: hypothetical protein VH277_12820 [Gemmatimonadaceae bacterium]|jgi:predicted DNA-binding protein with PD1-like motif|nr:hypothetical protein [Gemmatimonadaceae bacterium]